MIPYDTHNVVHVLLIVLFSESVEDDQHWRSCEEFCMRALLQQFKRQTATLILLSELVLSVFFHRSPSLLLSRRRITCASHIRLSGRADACSEQAPRGRFSQGGVPSGRQHVRLQGGAVAALQATLRPVADARERQRGVHAHESGRDQAAATVQRRTARRPLRLRLSAGAPSDGW